MLLFSEILKHDPARPDWFDRDRFVLSAGHGSMLLYALLHLSGYDLSLDEIRRFRQLHSQHARAPRARARPPASRPRPVRSVRAWATRSGMALAERLLAARFGSELVDHRTYALASDGDLMEGVSQRGVLARRAPRPGPARGPLRRQPDHDRRADLARVLGGRRRGASKSYGWDVQRADGHAPDAVRAALERARATEDRPHLIVCRTHIGFGSPAVDTAGAHGSFKDPEYTEQTRADPGLDAAAVRGPRRGARAVPRQRGPRRARCARDWEKRRARVLADPGLAALWRAMVERALPADLAAILPQLRGEKPMATRAGVGHGDQRARREACPR